MKPALVILAAGMGSRYGGLKQMDGVGPNGEAIIEYSIHDAIKAGFGKIVFIIRKDFEEAFREKIGKPFEDKVQIEYVFQAFDSPIEGISEWPYREKPWGTAHAMLVAEHVTNEPFAVINADDYYGHTSFQTMADFLTKECTEHTQSMLGYVLDNTLSDHGTVNRGVCEMDENHNLADVNERLKIKRNEAGVIEYTEGEAKFPIPDGSLVSMNFWGFHPSIFEPVRQQFIEFVEANKENPREEFFIPLFVDKMIKNGDIEVKVIPCHDSWYGVTYQEDKEPVQKAFDAMVKDGVYPNNLHG